MVSLRAGLPIQREGARLEPSDPERLHPERHGRVGLQLRERDDEGCKRRAVVPLVLGRLLHWV